MIGRKAPENTFPYRIQEAIYLTVFILLLFRFSMLSYLPGSRIEKGVIETATLHPHYFVYEITMPDQRKYYTFSTTKHQPGEKVYLLIKQYKLLELADFDYWDRFQKDIFALFALFNLGFTGLIFLLSLRYKGVIFFSTTLFSISGNLIELLPRFSPFILIGLALVFIADFSAPLWIVLTVYLAHYTKEMKKTRDLILEP